MRRDHATLLVQRLTHAVLPCCVLRAVCYVHIGDCANLYHLAAMLRTLAGRGHLSTEDVLTMCSSPVGIGDGPASAALLRFADEYAEHGEVTPGMLLKQRLELPSTEVRGVCRAVPCQVAGQPVRRTRDPGRTALWLGWAWWGCNHGCLMWTHSGACPLFSCVARWETSLGKPTPRHHHRHLT